MTREAHPPLAPARAVLRLLSTAPKRAILGALARGPLRPVELSGQLLISSATLYRHLPELEELGIVVKCEANPAPYAVEYSLTQSGVELCQVVAQVESWLRFRLPLPLDPASQSAWKAATALGEGWAASIMQRLVGRPLSETELVAQVLGLSHYEIRGRLSRLVDAGVLKRVVAAGGRGKSHYALSEWGRRGIGVLAIAARWEGLYIPDQSAPASVEDGIAALLVTLPLIRLAKQLNGVCEFRIREDQGGRRIARQAVWAEVSDGHCTRCGLSDSPYAPRAWAYGSLADWFAVVIDRRPSALRRGGDQKFANGILVQLHQQLYCYEDRRQESPAMAKPES